MPLKQISGRNPLPSWKIYAAGVILALAGLLAYSNSFTGPFVFDDIGGIVKNDSIRNIGDSWSPPANGETVSSRPLLNFTLALNYAYSELSPTSYHLVNLLIHLAAGLLLFGLVRRTLELPTLSARFGSAALPLAFVIALVWIVHPLQSEAVTYIVQRAESLMGLFYLLTLYAFVRSVDAKEAVWWRWLAVLTCLAGMLTKEVMVTAPLVVVLYDRTFLAGTFAKAWQQRRKFYVSLAVTWVALVVVLLMAPGRGGTVGFSSAVSMWDYALKQNDAIVSYLKLAVWPHPLVLDYGSAQVDGLGAIAPQALLLAVLLAGTIYALRRKASVGFAGAFFFLVLAPTSSFVPVATQTMAEHRMYLPLAAVLAALVLVTYAWAGRKVIGLWLAIALALGCITFARNRDYRTTLALWTDTVQKNPDSARAHSQLGNVYFRTGQSASALPEYLRVAEIYPAYRDAYNDIGLVQLRQGRVDDALVTLAKSVQLHPDFADAHFDYGNALLAANQLDEAERQYRSALELKPDYAEAHNNLGAVFYKQGKITAAGGEFQEALRLLPSWEEARNNLAQVQALESKPQTGK